MILIAENVDLAGQICIFGHSLGKFRQKVNCR